METFSVLLALCAGNSPVTDEFPSQRPVTWSFDVFFDLHLNKGLSKQSCEAGDLRRHHAHYDVIVMAWRDQFQMEGGHVMTEFCLLGYQIDCQLRRVFVQKRAISYPTVFKESFEVKLTSVVEEICPFVCKILLWIQCHSCGYQKNSLRRQHEVNLTISGSGALIHSLSFPPCGTNWYQQELAPHQWFLHGRKSSASYPLWNALLY